MASFLHSKEGVTQGDPLAMISYMIHIFPLIKNLKQDIPDVTQPWCADDDGALGTFAIIDTYFYSLTRQCPECRYYPKLSKSAMIMHLENIEARKEFEARHVFKVCTGTSYLGDYIRVEKSKSDCMRECTLMWETNIKTISKTVGKYPQERYATVVQAIQS